MLRLKESYNHNEKVPDHADDVYIIASITIVCPIGPGEPANYYTSPTMTITIPPFIRPSVNPSPGCDIWGPICQTGTIVIAASLSDTTTTTTMPCSAYLEAQSSSAISALWCSAEYYQAGAVATMVLPDYYRSFGRSPQCTSYIAEVVGANFDLYVNNTSGVDSPNCGNYTDSRLPLLPVGIQLLDDLCCGPCLLAVQQIQVFYFPDDDSSNCSKNTSSLSPATLTQQLHTLLRNGSRTAVVNGYTLYVTLCIDQATQLTLIEAPHLQFT